MILENVNVSDRNKQIIRDDNKLNTMVGYYMDDSYLVVTGKVESIFSDNSKMTDNQE